MSDFKFYCNICDKSFNSKYSLSGHKRIHGVSNGKTVVTKCCCLITKREIPVHYLKEYQSKIKYCYNCNSPLNSNRKFCK